MKAIITAGGRGTRMRPLTFSSNKHLIPLANKPLIHYAIETVVAAGVTQIGLNYNPGQLEELQAALGDGSRWGAKFTYILQEQPLGLANIVQVCQKFIGSDKFFMHLGDNIFYGGIKPLVDYFATSKAAGLLTIMHHPENTRLGVPYFDKKGNLVKYVEKPQNPPHDWAVPGLYFADPRIFDCFTKDPIQPSARGEYEIPSTFQWLIDHKYNVETMEFKGTWCDPGKFNDWLDTNRFLLDNELTNEYLQPIGEDVKLEGRVKIGKNCHLSHSTLRGPIIIGDDVQINDSFIGPYSSIGNNCQITKSKLENTILMDEVIVANLPSPLDSSLIGKGTTISGNQAVPETLELFVGNQCTLKL